MDTTPVPTQTPAAAAAPTTTPTAPVTKDPVKAGLLASVLGLVEKEKKPVEEKKPETPAGLKVEASPKKVAVKVREKKPDPAPERAPQPLFDEAKLEEVVKRAIKPESVQAPVVPSVPDPTDLTDAEREEYELAKYFEEKDPSKKGLTQELSAFYRKQKEFLEKRAEEEGSDYDPSTDVAFKKFIEKNSPKFGAGERRRAREMKLVEETERRASERTRAEVDPKIKKLEDDLRETRERPHIERRIGDFVAEVTRSMPQEVLGFHAKNGNDITKTRDAFPVEVEVITDTTEGAKRLAGEYLAIRRGLKEPSHKDPGHTLLANLVDSQAQELLKTGRPEYLTRNGKQFIHPSRMTPALERTHWTFDENDVLTLIKYAARREANDRISARYQELDRLGEAKKKRVSTLSGAGKTPEVPEASPRSGAATPSGGPSSGVKSKNTLLGVLGF